MKKMLFASHSATLTGAPHVLLNIASSIDRDRFEPLALFPERGPMVTKFENANIPVTLIETGESRWGRWHVPMIEAFCATKQTDVLHANTVHSYPFVIAARKIGIPCFWYLHEMMTSGLEFRIPDEDFRLAVQGATRIGTVSDACRLQFLEYCSSRQVDSPEAVVVHNGIHVPSGNDAETVMKEPVQLLAIGNLAPHKGYDFLIEALGLLTSRARGAELTVLGDGDSRYFARLWEKAEDTGVAERIHFLTAQADTGGWTQEADIVVNPSVVENFSLSVAEAMAYAKPIIATDVGAIREFFVDGETGLIVPPANPDALAQAILRFMEDPRFARECGERARDHIARNFPLSKQVERMERHYLELADTATGKDVDCLPLLVDGLISVSEKIAELENEIERRHAFLSEYLENVERDIRTLEGVVDNLLQKFPLRLYRKITRLFK